MHPLPGWPEYAVDLKGNIFKHGQLRKPTYKSKAGGRAKINLCRSGYRATKTRARVVLEAKLGRKLEPFEDACHINGDPSDDRMENLKAADRLNNIIDEVELGRIGTTPEYIALAIKRLQDLQSKME